MKKFICTICLLTMCMSMVACAGGNDVYSKEDEFTKDGKLILEYFAIDLDTLQSQTKDTEKIIDFIEDKFQVSFKFLSGTATSWQLQLNQYIAGGDVPDMFFHDRKEPSYSTWLKEKYLFNYSDLLDGYPNLKSAFLRYDEKSIKTLLGGDNYGYPIMMNSETDSEVINEHALFYRRDWYTNLRAKNWAPTSGRALVDPEDESFNYLNFWDLCEGYTGGDPDNNGKDDTYAYSLTKDGGVYWWYPILSMFGVTAEGWFLDGDKWMPECISPQMKKAVMFMADMFDRGFINQNYATTTTQAVMKNNFLNGLAGMMCFNATYPMGGGVLDLMKPYIKDGQTISDVVRAMPVVTGEDGTKTMRGGFNNYGYLSINNDVTDNKKNKILSIMDWMLTDEGMTLLNYGIENEHYKVENGQIVSLLGTNSNGKQMGLYDGDVAPGAFRIKGLVSWSTIMPKNIENYDEQMQLLNAWEEKYLVLDELAFASVDSSFALKIASLNSATEIAYKNIVTKVAGNAKEERENIWNSYVLNYKRNADTYITAMNESAKELLGA